MNKKYRKPLLIAGAAIVLVAIILIIIFSGKKTPPAQNPDEAYTAVGYIYFTFDSEMRIGYNNQGQVVSVTSVNEAAGRILAGYTDFGQMDCAAAVTDLTGIILENSNPAYKAIVLTQEWGSVSPSDTFMADLQQSVQQAIPEYTVIAIGADALDAEGYLKFEDADAILRAALSLPADLKFPSAKIHMSELYDFTVPINGQNIEYRVNAKTGTVNTAAELGLDFEGSIGTEPESDVTDAEFPDENLPINDDEM